MRVARVDRNQPEIVAALRKAGASIQYLHTLGRGCPDILVGYENSHGIRVNVLMEIKDGSQPPSKQRLTEDEVWWHLSWLGQVCVVNSIEQALAAIGVAIEQETT